MRLLVAGYWTSELKGYKRLDRCINVLIIVVRVICIVIDENDNA
jgi:hypothetical protein